MLLQPKLLATIQECIRREQLAEAGQHIYVAVSGGADSVALLTALYLLGYRLTILHCNFHLRGEESDSDEKFVVNLAQRRALPYFIQHYDTKQYAQEQGISIEMAARILRYEWFEQILAQEPSARVAIAHNADDLLETLLLNLSKGTGIRGLSGMPYSRNGGLIRPMLDVPRQEIEIFLSEQGEDFRQDSSNNELIYQRNYIRHRLLPAFGELNTDYRRSLGTTIVQMRGAEAFYRESIRRHKAQVLVDGAIDIEQLLISPHPETLLFEILQPYGFSSSQCYAIADNLQSMRSGATFLSATCRLVCSWSVLELLPREVPTYQTQAIDLEDLPKAVNLHDGRRLICTLVPLAEELQAPNVLYLPYKRIVDKHIVLRQVREGERMQPFGMKRGTKKINRIFIDGKIPQSIREKSILLCVNDQPWWLLGITKSELARISQPAEEAPFLKLSIE